MKKLKEKIQALSLENRKSIYYGWLAVSVVLLLIGCFGNYVLLALGMLTLFLMLFYCFMAFRCPACNAYLGQYMIRYSHCPKCGKNLTE